MEWTVHTGSALDLYRLIEPRTVAAIVTDPPYAVTGDAAVSISRQQRPVPELQFYVAWLREHLQEWRRLLAPGGAVFLTIDWRGCLALDEAAAREGFPRAPTVGVWDKERIGMGFVLRRSYETFAVLLTDGFTPSTRSARDVWRIPWGGGRTGKTTHPSEKPVRLMTRAIELLTHPGDLVLDPFCGTGATGVAAVRLDRPFIGFEREAEHADCARDRVRNEISQGRLELPERTP